MKGDRSHRGAQLKMVVAGFSLLQKGGGTMCVGLELVYRVNSWFSVYIYTRAYRETWTCGMCVCVSAVRVFFSSLC